jgi:hypothetical protein
MSVSVQLLTGFTIASAIVILVVDSTFSGIEVLSVPVPWIASTSALLFALCDVGARFALLFAFVMSAGAIGVRFVEYTIVSWWHYRTKVRPQLPRRPEFNQPRLDLLKTETRESLVRLAAEQEHGRVRRLQSARTIRQSDTHSPSCDCEKCRVGL